MQLLSQMASQLTELQNNINASRERVTTLFDEGRKHLETMRTLVSAPGAIDQRADQFAAEVVTLTARSEDSTAETSLCAAALLSLGIPELSNRSTPWLSLSRDAANYTWTNIRRHV